MTNKKRVLLLSLLLMAVMPVPAFAHFAIYPGMIAIVLGFLFIPLAPFVFYIKRWMLNKKFPESQCPRNTIILTIVLECSWLGLLAYLSSTYSYYHDHNFLHILGGYFLAMPLLNWKLLNNNLKTADLKTKPISIAYSFALSQFTPLSFLPAVIFLLFR
ncbi:MAG: hypothetical protein GY765_30655 [bacterium]|nr:hypothetical protein [bacterium]